MDFHYFAAPIDAMQMSVDPNEPGDKVNYSNPSAVDSPLAVCSFCNQPGPHFLIKCNEGGETKGYSPTYYLSETVDKKGLMIETRQPEHYPRVPDYFYRGCFACLKKGVFTAGHGTEAGDICCGEWERCETSEDEIPASAIEELARTPEFNSWQESTWLVHCNDFMIYLGEWGREDFNEHAPDGNGEALHAQVEQDAIWGAETWEELRGNGFYVFRCSHCGAMRSFIDWD